MLFAQLFVYALLIYAAAGILFALFFVFARIHIVDPVAKEAGIFFRFLIFFGSVALWPILLKRSFGKAGEVVEINAHRKAAGRYK
jgi:hypothetical protein